MIQNYPTFEEKTVLKPLETQVEIEATIVKVENLLEPKYGAWTFKFSPLTNSDSILLDNAMDNAVSQLNMAKHRLSRKKANLNCLRGGLYYCDQLFAPVCNTEFDSKWDAQGKHVSLKLHFRDDPEGNIYLQCEYCDFMDPLNGVVEEQKIEDYTGPIDYDF